jgi:hypothetical protein
MLAEHCGAWAAADATVSERWGTGHGGVLQLVARHFSLSAESNTIAGGTTVAMRQQP